MGGSNSAVECQLPKLDVAGSIPVSRSNSFGCRFNKPYRQRVAIRLQSHRGPREQSCGSARTTNDTASSLLSHAILESIDSRNFGEST